MITVDISIVAEIITLIAAIVGFSIIIGRYGQRIDQLEKDVVDNRKRIKESEQNHNNSDKILERLRADIEYIRESQDNATKKLDDLNNAMQHHFGEHGKMEDE